MRGEVAERAVSVEAEQHIATVSQRVSEVFLGEYAQVLSIAWNISDDDVLDPLGVEALDVERVQLAPALEIALTRGHARVSASGGRCRGCGLYRGCRPLCR